MGPGKQKGKEAETPCCGPWGGDARCRRHGDLRGRSELALE